MKFKIVGHLAAKVTFASPLPKSIILLYNEGRPQVQNVSVAVKVRSRYRVIVTYAK